MKEDIEPTHFIALSFLVVDKCIQINVLDSESVKPSVKPHSFRTAILNAQKITEFYRPSQVN